MALIGLSAPRVYRSFERAAERRRAIEQADSGEGERALPALLQCLERAPDDAELLRAVVGVLTARRTPSPDLVTYAARWSAAHPDNPEPCRIRLESLRKSNHFTEAVLVAERLVELAPEDAAARRELSLLYVTVGRFDDARRECLALMKLDPQPDWELLMGRIELGREDLAAAAKALDSALARMPENPSALVFRGIVHNRAQEYSAAIAVLRRARPTVSVLRISRLNELGLALSRSNRPEEARVVFDELTRNQEADLLAGEARSRPKDAGMQLNAGRALLEAGRAEEARDLVEEAIRRAGERRDFLTLLAKCHSRLGREDLAREARERAAKGP